MTSERELEALAAEGLDYFEKAGDDGDKVYVRAIRELLARRLQPARVPEGWQLVPCEASEEMWSATTEVSQYVAFDRFARDYKRLLSAAPAAEGGMAECVGPHGRTLQLALAVIRDQAGRAEAMGANGIAANLREAHDDIEATAGNPAPESREAGSTGEFGEQFIDGMGWVIPMRNAIKYATYIANGAADELGQRTGSRGEVGDA